jgi:two-component system, NarL family, sensor kinase
MKSRPVLVVFIQFFGWALLTSVLLAVFWASALRKTSYQEALQQSRNETGIIGNSIVSPILTDQIFDGNAQYLAQVDRVVHENILPLGVKRLKLWSADGTILYSDEPRLIGSVFELEGKKAVALQTGTSAASVSDLNEPENKYEKRDARYIEVYYRVKTKGGKDVLLETYYSTETITQNRNRVFRSFRPIVLGALATLGLFVGPLLWSTVRTIRRSQDSKEALLSHALASSDLERSRIARDLHDGVVQDLAGVSLTIAGVLDRLGPDREPQLRGPLTEAAASTRHGIRQLRTLLVDLVPRDLARTGLEPALSDLMSGLQRDGIQTSLNVEPNLGLTETEQSLIYRTSQEALRNVHRHAKASRVDVSIDQRASRVELLIVDDGIGFDPEAKRPAENLGLDLVRRAAANHGSMYTVISTPGEGTRVSLSLPSRPRFGKR